MKAICTSAFEAPQLLSRYFSSIFIALTFVQLSFGLILLPPELPCLPVRTLLTYASWGNCLTRMPITTSCRLVPRPPALHLLDWPTPRPTWLRYSYAGSIYQCTNSSFDVPRCLRGHVAFLLHQTYPTRAASLRNPVAQEAETTSKGRHVLGSGRLCEGRDGGTM